MPTSNRIILTDVDGVLLEWENHFTKWMTSKGYQLQPNMQSEYNMHVRFGEEPDTVKNRIREFNCSAWMGTQEPMRGSVQWVKLLHAEGWTFVPITSQTSDLPAQALRKRRLTELFGPDVFSNYFILETGADKDSVLEEFRDTGLYWVEDKWANALAGLKYGLKSILIDHNYNREFSHPDIVRVNTWKQVHQIVSGRK